MATAPTYQGSGLVNMMAEMEARLSGSSVWEGLSPELSDAFPEARTYVLVLFDGLGVAQLDHPAAAPLTRDLAGILEAPFPTTTSVSLATVATALPPSRHGQVAHLTWFEELGKVVNTLKWVTVHGEHVEYDYSRLLPSPNLWERLRATGVEPVTVQPGEFQASPLSQVLYRGARFEQAWDMDDLVEATVQLAREPGRLIFTYINHVDFAGHVFGLESEEFAEATKLAVTVWERLASSLPEGAALVGTADHGLVEFTDKVLVRDRRYDSLRFAGDARGVQLWGKAELMEELAELTGGILVDPVTLMGPDPSPEALTRTGDRVLLAPADKVILPRGFDKRLRSYHGGLTRAEVEVPLLVSRG
ncbi:MAG: alkaline phosphatase family protein [Acidimicrobiia bacterium]